MAEGRWFRMFAVLVLVLQAPMLAQVPDWTVVVRNPAKSVVRLETLKQGAEDPGRCSGAVINKELGVVLTAAHCVDKPQTEAVSITVNGRHAEILKVNTVLDLALLKTTLRGEEQILLADKTPEPGTPVAVIGFAWGDPDLSYQFGYVAQTSNRATKLALLDANVIGGDSGGVCIDAHGKLVAINAQLWSWHSSGHGASVPTEILKDFAENFLPKTTK